MASCRPRWSERSTSKPAGRCPPCRARCASCAPTSPRSPRRTGRRAPRPAGCDPRRAGRRRPCRPRRRDAACSAARAPRRSGLKAPADGGRPLASRVTAPPQRADARSRSAAARTTQIGGPIGIATDHRRQNLLKLWRHTTAPTPASQFRRRRCPLKPASYIDSPGSRRLVDAGGVGGSGGTSCLTRARKSSLDRALSFPALFSHSAISLRIVSASCRSPGSAPRAAPRKTSSVAEPRPKSRVTSLRLGGIAPVLQGARRVVARLAPRRRRRDVKASAG